MHEQAYTAEIWDSYGVLQSMTVQSRQDGSGKKAGGSDLFVGIGLQKAFIGPPLEISGNRPI
jgi:hypothetical protein